MRLGTRAAAYGITGLVLAGAVIFSGSALGLLSPSSSGVLSILLTDPPTVPSGVSAVYVTYDNIAVHAVGFGDAGWVAVPGHGTIDTLGLVNLSRTISSAVVPSLVYNIVRFNITGASVEFNGANYTVGVSAGQLTVPFVGGLKVNSSSTAAALVDISPTVLNLGNQSSPDFTMAAGARALQVPSTEVRDSMRTVGNETSLQGRGWFQSFRSSHNDNLNVTALNLTSNSLSFTAFNPGTDSLNLRLVIVTQDAPRNKEAGQALGALGSSFVFAVQPDGSLRLLGMASGDVESSLGGQGYTLAAGSNHSFSYSGAITNTPSGTTITSGTGYTVVLMGDGPLSVENVTAS